MICKHPQQSHQIAYIMTIEKINLVIVFDLGWLLDLNDPMRSDSQTLEVYTNSIIETLSSNFFVFV